MPVARFDDRQVRFHTDYVGPRRGGVGPSMNHDTDECGEVAGKARENVDDGADASRGCANDDDISRNLLSVNRGAHGRNVARSRPTEAEAERTSRTCGPARHGAKRQLHRAESAFHSLGVKRR